jgi:cobalamin biosynthesis protein CobT
MGKDVYDLLIGHEVGHAIETPFEGWHDSPEKLEGCPRTYINVVEDARIERKIQSRYPGLVNSFNKGYKKLLDNEFFGPLDDVDYDQVKLIDKINLKTKLGSLIEVPFSSEEAVFLTRANTTQTFDEVVQLVKDILKFTQDNTPELIQQPEPEQDIDNSEEESQNKEQEESTIPSGHDDYEKEESEEKSNQTTQGDQSSGEDVTEEESEEETTTSAAQPEHQEADVSITDRIYRSKEKSLIETSDNGKSPLVVSQVSKENISTSIVPFKQLMKDRENEAKRMADHYESSWIELLDDYPSYMKQLKKNVQPAVR